MKFVTGLLTGIALGAAGAVYYSVRSGKDLRATYEDVRAEIDARNYEALGARIERGFAEIQAELEERLNQVRAGANAALDEGADTIEDVTTEIEARADEATSGGLQVEADSIVDDARDTLDSVEDAAASAASDAADEIGDTADDWSRERA